MKKDKDLERAFFKKTVEMSLKVGLLNCNFKSFQVSSKMMYSRVQASGESLMGMYMKVRTYINPCLFIGEFFRGQLEGGKQGKIRFPDGSTYEGIFWLFLYLMIFRNN